jgi:hypothetical protein
MAIARDERSIGSLIRELSSDGGTLVRQEIELARTELGEKIDLLRHSLVRIGIGAAVLLAGILVLFTAVNRALTVVLAQFMSTEVAVWLSPLIIASVLFLVGWSFIRKGRRGIKTQGLAPKQTAESLKEDGRWLKEKVTS